MLDITIQRVSPVDIPKLQKISKQTFYETFSKENSEENMKNYLEEEFSLKKLTAELEDVDSEFYVAKLYDNIIGYLKLNVGSAQTELKHNNSLEIERIYVLQEFQGKKVGQLLFDKAMERANVKKMYYIWLGVWEENHRAIQFYKKNGFVEFDKHFFKLGDDLQTDIMMKLILTTN